MLHIWSICHRGAEASHVTFGTYGAAEQMWGHQLDLHMSFMGGSACSTSSNPLAQMAKQQSMDRTHQFEQLQGPSGQASLRSDPRQMSAADRELLQSLERQAGAQNFQYGDMRHELSQLGPMSSNHAGLSSRPQGDWSEEYNTRYSSPRPSGGSNWASEFSPQSMGPSQPGPSHMQQSYRPQMSGMGMGMSMRSGPMMSSQPQMHQTNSRIVELDTAQWEEQFKNAESQATSKSESRQTDGGQASATAENVTVEELLQEKEIGIEDGYDSRWFEGDGETHYPEGWDDVWARIKDQVNDDSGGHMRAGDFTSDFDHYAGSLPHFGEYQPAEQNPYVETDDPFAMGVALMDQGAKLSLAILCFEAAIQRDANHIEAWARLGAAHAQNENEGAAIRALEHCTKIDPKNEQALMHLAVSYTNEGYENAAYATLERWLATKYPDLASQVAGEAPNLDRLDLHGRVTGLFLKAAQMSPDMANMDVDVQAGLGVLFYGNEEYEKAVDCFRSAIAVRPNDPLLWNRLGATLANSNRSEEAIEAYSRALELRPSFVRARYNVGVSCINIGCYREAAEHLLAALTLRGVGDGEEEVGHSSNLCDTLRRVFLAMDRRDLIAKVGPSMDLNQFRQEFNF